MNKTSKAIVLAQYLTPGTQNRPEAAAEKHKGWELTGDSHDSPQKF
jgi:hypothetical protein